MWNRSFESERSRPGSIAAPLNLWVVWNGGPGQYVVVIAMIGLPQQAKAASAGEGECKGSFANKMSLIFRNC
jgi:hypothetical protein